MFKHITADEMFSIITQHITGLKRELKKPYEDPREQRLIEHEYLSFKALKWHILALENGRRDSADWFGASLEKDTGLIPSQEVEDSYLYVY